jgi:hypothetical protein
VRWEKLGHVYVARGEASWARSRASVPTVLALDAERLRVFVAFVDEQKIGRLGFVDVDARDPTRVLDVSATPALDIGTPGTFDDNGVMPMSVFEHQGRVWLYYSGWQLGVRIRYFLFTGLAHSDDQGRSFTRHGRVPVLDRSDAEPTLRSGAFAQPTDGGFRMWYSAGEEWVEAHGRAMPSYGMLYVESPDGVTWAAQGRPCMQPRGPNEFGLVRPYVLDEGDRLRMWYSIRRLDTGYRLGYAESTDGGLAWERRDDEVGIDVSAEGWDSEMVCYPCVQRTAFGTYLFYNGNGYGETGFGVAALSSSS